GQHKVGVIYSETRRITNINYKNLKRNHFQITFNNEDGVNTVRLHGWNILMMRNFLGVNLWVKQTLSLYEKYVERYGKPDIIHVHCGLYGGLAAKVIKDKYSIPYVITEHSSIILNNSLNDYNKQVLTVAYNNADKLISVGNKLKCSMKNYTNNDIVVVPNIVNTDGFKVSKEYKREKFRFLTVAYLKKNKRIDLVIEAFTKLKEKHNNIELYIGGDGPEKTNIQGLIDKHNLNEYVHLLGEVSRKDLPKVMGNSDCFVLPSMYETFGVVYIEALACGIPIIATRCGGPEDFFNENLGYMIDVDNLNELCNVMENILINNSKFDRNEISEYVKNRFGRKAIVQELEKVYNSIIE
ncbi:MAG: glycosyltransferase, partial [Clostridium sp.]|uniref:glycosyltransferase n=1 Tax=Clostridium sp. TaxID=1506 RepID=UPI002907C71A